MEDVHSTKIYVLNVLVLSVDFMGIRAPYQQPFKEIHRKINKITKSKLNSTIISILCTNVRGAIAKHSWKIIY